MKKKIVLITCCRKKKCDHRPRPARDIYCAERFVAEREYAERVGSGGWFILSAKHKLLSPERKIKKYDQVLKCAQKKPWAEKVFAMLKKKGLTSGKHEFIILFDEANYCKDLTPKLKQSGVGPRGVKLPLEGLAKAEAVFFVKLWNLLKADGIDRRALQKTMTHKRKSKGPPTHPGEILSDIVLPGANLSVSEFAQMLGVSRHVLRGILAAERPVTPEIAVRLGKLLNTSTDVWLNMQISRDLWLARKSLRPEMRRLGAAGKKLARKAGTGQFQTAAHV